MKLYSDFGARRTAQILGDVFALLVLVGGIAVAGSISNAIAALAAIGRSVQESGSGLASTMSDIGDTLASIPLIGGSIRAPFDAASGAGGTLQSAGEDWQLGVHTLAVLSGWTVAAVVVVILLLGWVRPRLVGALRRGKAARLMRSPGAVELLAFRALTNGSPQELMAIDPAVMRAWGRGDTEVIRQLAALELRAAGVRLRG